MKKNLLAFAVAAAIAAPGMAFAADSNNADTGPVLYGYGQITGSQQFGTNGPEGIAFGGHRVRLGVKGVAVPGVSYMFQYKWDGLYDNKNPAPYSPGNSGVQKVWLNFNFIPAMQIKVGKYRAPIGMERTQYSGNDLWFIQRSMNQSLGANYVTGVMLHSPNVMNTGLYYSAGVFNNQSYNGDAFNGGFLSSPFGAGQSNVGGVTTNGSGHYLFAGMIGYKVNPLLNVEISGGRADVKNYFGSPGQVDSWNVGASGGLMGLKYMAEYSHVNTYKGIAGLRASDWYVALAANLHAMTLSPLDIEPAVRFERFDFKGGAVPGAIDGVYLNNTTIGVNYYVNPNNPYAADVQLNYVIPTGARGYRYLFNNGMNYVPTNAYIYNTLALQFQVGF